jgi:hypothetical protein
MAQTNDKKKAIVRAALISGRTTHEAAKLARVPVQTAAAVKAWGTIELNKLTK